MLGGVAAGASAARLSKLDDRRGSPTRGTPCRGRVQATRRVERQRAQCVHRACESARAAGLRGSNRARGRRGTEGSAPARRQRHRVRKGTAETRVRAGAPRRGASRRA
eukprot:8785595-Alexandrium_andersonii.AAC.1